MANSIEAMTAARRPQSDEFVLSSHVGVSGRMSVGEDGHQPIFHPSNGDVTHAAPVPQDPGLFTIRFLKLSTAKVGLAAWEPVPMQAGNAALPLAPSGQVSLVPVPFSMDYDPTARLRESPKAILSLGSPATMTNESSPRDARGWAASSSSSLQLTLNLHGSLPVRLIATPRRSFTTCCTGENLSDVVANNVESFDHLPVIDSSQGDVETIVGLLNVRSIGSEERLKGTVRERMNPLSEQLLIGADASILDFLMVADRQRCRLVVSESEISGLVSLSDLQRLPVRAALFALITQSEITMADAIRRECSDPYKESDTWINRLSVDRQDKIQDEIGKSTDEDGFVDSLLFTQYGDKVTILRKSPRFQWSKTKFKSDMRNVESLRDQIAHANDYASTPAAAEQVCSTVRSLDCWNRRLASWPNRSVAD